jgi:hypothetical protein
MCLEINLFKLLHIEQCYILHIKLKLCHYTPQRHLGERRYSSYSFLASSLDGGEWSASCPSCALVPGKGLPVPTVQGAGWASEPVWTQRLQEKSFRLCQGSNLDHPVVQPVARHYTKLPSSHILHISRRFPWVRFSWLKCSSHIY